MCQAIAEGGRRCPAHRRDTIAVIHAVTSATSLPQDITEELFVELRREARHMDTNQGLEDSYAAVISETEQLLEGIDTGTRYRTILAERSSDEAPAPDTAYALTRLKTAARERSQALHQELQVIAENNGITLGEARRRWDQARQDVKDGSVEVSDADWNDAAQDDAFNRNLPYDKASVVAFARLRENATQARGERRVTPVDFTHRSTSIHSAGYNPEGGRLEVTFQSNPERVYAYHSVPESAWENMCDENSSPGRVVRQFLRNSDHQYATQEEADNDAYTVRCSSCGQFASASAHTCPERVVEESGIEAPEEVAEAVYTRLREVEPEIIEGNVSVETVIESSIRESEDTTEIEDVPEDTSVSNVNVDEETGVPTLELPYDRSEMVPRDATAAEREAIEAYDREVDAAVARINELNALEDAREAIEGGPSQDGSIQHRVAEQIIDFDRSEESPLINSRYRVRSADGYGRDSVQDSPTRNRTERTNVMDIVIDNFSESPRGVNTWYTPDGDSRHYVSSFSAHQYGLSGYSARESVMHTPMAPGPFNVTEEHEYDSNGEIFRTTRIVTDQERTRVQNEYDASPDGQIERTEFDRNQTLSRAHAPRMMNEDGQNVLEGHRVAWAGVRDVRRTLAEDGGTVAAPIEYEVASPRHMVRDEHGNVLRPRDSNAVVTGMLAVTREGDNYRTVSGRHELRCTCIVYRRNYHCRHVDFVRDNGYRIARNMATPAASGASSGPFQAQLMNRVDFNHFTEEDGTLVGRFTAQGATRRSRPDTLASRYIRTDDVNVESPTPEDTSLLLMAERSRLSLPRPNIVRTALGRAGRVDVELGLYTNRMADPLAYAQNSITGTIGLTRHDDGTISVNMERARCSCGRFTSAEEAGGGTCPHFERYETFATRYFNNSVDETNMISLADRMQVSEDAANRAELRVRQQLERERERPGNENLTDEQLRASIEARVEEARREAEEQAERDRQWRAQREAEAAEERRRANLSFAERAQLSETEVRAERNEYLERNPEFAEGLAQYKEHRASQWEAAEPGYGDNTDAIRADVESALAARESRSGTHLETMTSGVTDGICDPNVPGHRKFGVELEFDFPASVNRGVAIQNIVNELREAGLTEQTGISGYHSGQASGWAKWSLESDVTVSGELVSPLLDDSEESWEQMKTALDILKRHGARTSTRTGSHVHVSSGSYLKSLAKHSELSATVLEHQDVLFRAAADPTRRQHRGRQWCAPNVQPPEVNIGADQRGTGYADPSISRLSQHANMVNFEASRDLSKKEHVEFRMWDGSLDLATIQQQVAASAAMTDYADRKVDTDGQYTGTDRATRQQLDIRPGSTDVTDDSLKNVGNFVDKIFRRQEDRKRFIAMFAANKWAN